MNDYVEAGLPTHTHTRGTMNITGTVQHPGAANSQFDGSLEVSGAFGKTSLGNTKIVTDTGGTYAAARLDFNAANSWTGATSAPDNALYGKSNTVQPPSSKKLLYYVVGNTTSKEGLTEVVAQGMEILEQVNQGLETRVKLDGSNAEFPHIIETYRNGASWYRVYSDGWCEQGGKATSTSQSLQNPVYLLKHYADTNYYVNANVNEQHHATIYAYSTSEARFGVITAQVGWGAGTITWMACGYIG